MFILDEDEDKIHTDSEYVNKSSSDNGSSNYWRSGRYSQI